VTGPFDCHTVGDGGTFIINPDGDGNDTATLNAAAATSLSGATPSVDISAGADNKFLISVNGDEAEEVELTLVSCDSGAAIATEMQTQIQALAGEKTGVTVSYNAGANGKYLITSALLGTASAVVVTAAPLNNVTEELKIGEDAGGVETAGTGDCVDITAVTADEIVTLCDTDLQGMTVTNVAESIVVTSDTAGGGSSLVFGSGTLNTILGFTNSEEHYGTQGLGYATDMANDTYAVVATLNGVAQATLADKGLSITSRAAGGFNVECETAAATDDVDLIIIGTPAAAA
jgi:hypothetical protein